MKEYYKGEPKILVSVDCIVLGFEDKKLRLLVGKRKVEPGSGKLSLDGGFVRENESLKQAANRVLCQCTGIKDIYMLQVGAFGETDRDPGDRVISIAYCALINAPDYDRQLLEKNDLQWVDIDKIPELYGDHSSASCSTRPRSASACCRNCSPSHSCSTSTRRFSVRKSTSGISGNASSRPTSSRRPASSTRSPANAAQPSTVSTGRPSRTLPSTDYKGRQERLATKPGTASQQTFPCSSSVIIILTHSVPTGKDSSSCFLPACCRPSLMVPLADTSRVRTRHRAIMPPVRKLPAVKHHPQGQPRTSVPAAHLRTTY